MPDVVMIRGEPFVISNLEDFEGPVIEHLGIYSGLCRER